MGAVRHVLLAAGLACGFVLAGELSPAAADGKVSGTVTLMGKPLAAGRILFHLGDGTFVGAAVKDGRYTVSRVPAGARVVTVEGDGVPAKYAAPDKSVLTVEVKEGNSSLDFDLR